MGTAISANPETNRKGNQMNTRKSLAGQSGNFNLFGLTAKGLAIYLGGAALVALILVPNESGRSVVEPAMSSAHATQNTMPQSQPEPTAAARGVEYFPAGYTMQAREIEAPIAQF